MTVAELIELLKKHPQDLQVIIPCCSEYVIFGEKSPQVVDKCIARPDGWVEEKRSDKPTQKYLLIETLS